MSTLKFYLELVLLFYNHRLQWAKLHGIYQASDWCSTSSDTKQTNMKYIFLYRTSFILFLCKSQIKCLASWGFEKNIFLKVCAYFSCF